MSEVVSISSGPQGTATNEEAFSPEPSHEFGQESSNGADNGSADSGVENVNGEGDGKPKSAAQKKIESRYERTKKERAAFRQQQEAFRTQQAQFARERADFEESKKPKRSYSLADLKKFLPAWQQEAEQGIDGREELVRKAQAEIAAMEAEEKASKVVTELPKYGTKEHRQMWETSETEIRQLDPDFMKAGTRLDTKLRELLSGPHGQTYRDHAQGIYAAYSEAKRQVLEEDNKGLRTENAQLKKELQRFGGLTSIGSGVPGRMGEGGVTSTSDFARLSTQDMRKHLLAVSKRNKDSSGWL